MRMAPTATSVTPFADGLAAVWFRAQCGYIDHSYELKIRMQFTAVAPFRHGLAWVEQGEQAGYIDRTGIVLWQGRRQPPREADY